MSEQKTVLYTPSLDSPSCSRIASGEEEEAAGESSQWEAQPGHTSWEEPNWATVKTKTTTWPLTVPETPDKKALSP